METVDHLLCMCEVALEFWAMVGRHTGMRTTFQTVEELWEEGAWTVWKTRNDAIFNRSRVYQENMWNMFRGLITYWGWHRAREGEIQFRDGYMRITG
ncbi:hypothetical protein QJS10_CPB11g00853 [Acorus calamus]|uniref:Uncharacterized protein n=1 Tax=Acorus calamus TaxID=4465 RepID=A0AAV9DUG0_ACOCL|nr:hypothetical protein QJS10_CPB11g00853 [Acorus calamus]